MKVATVRDPRSGETRAARVEGDSLVLLDHADAARALAAGDIAGDGPAVDLATADLGPPSLRPQKIFCVGLNYQTHILEMGRELPTHPTLFAKFARALIGPRDQIELPMVSDAVDWEVELAVVIGREVRHADPEGARAAICGYMVLNDISMRDYQQRTAQWLGGKTFERSTPTGPWLVTPEEVDHGADLELTCEVDGEVMQRGRTSDLVFDPAAVVAYISDIITLEPGDVVATGTPGGVGAGRTPPVFLKPGAEVRCHIEGIGELRNSCMPEVSDDTPDEH
jgi:acylpyruvate hydrolase